ncbi:FAD/NAD(P)-binding domain-containing protein [Thozetella sp. PMI_491]|nr:FAD/NAD(P)-binding domain-containing protein [Thozetella sp. PMI_491]
MPLSKIIIVGAGPSGLLLAVLLGKAGINVELLEMTHGLDTNPRASHYADSSMHEFERAGILDEVREEGFLPDGVSWRKLDEAKTRLVATPGVWLNDKTKPDPQTDRYHMVCLPLHKLGVILERAVNAQPTATIRYGHKVVDQGETAEHAWVRVETPDGEKVFEADYIVGCDGANSKVRRLLFGDDVFPGMTWKEQIVATNMYYDFSPYDYDDSQFFIHPWHYHMVAKIQKDGMYRVTYGEIGGLTTEELRARQPGKYATFLPGHPGPSEYKIVNFSPYKIHQRCVDKMRVGRFLLAADAGHLCNPFGGMGLTGGIADIGSLYDALYGIHAGLAGDTILDKYDEIRRKIWHEVINPVSTENLKRLIHLDPETAVETDPVFKFLKGMEEDIRNGKFVAPQGSTDTMRLMHDMTQYYNKA